MKVKIFYIWNHYADQMPKLMNDLVKDVDAWMETVNVIQISTGLGASDHSTEYCLTVLYTEK